MVIFNVFGEPQGKARPRVVKNRYGNIRAYTPKKTKEYEHEIAKAYQTEAKGKMFDGAVEIQIAAYCKIPNSASKENKAKMQRGEIKPCKKPDLDNIAKVVCDALNGIAYKDDSQVTMLKVFKRYTREPLITEPLISVTVREDSYSWTT